MHYGSQFRPTGTDKPKPTIACDVDGTLVFSQSLYHEARAAAEKLEYKQLWEQDHAALTQDGMIVHNKRDDTYIRYTLNKPLADALHHAAERGCKVSVCTGGDSKVFMRILRHLLPEEQEFTLGGVISKFAFKPHDNIIAAVDDEPKASFAQGCKSASPKCEILEPTNVEKLNAIVESALKADAGHDGAGTKPKSRRL